MTAVDIEDLTPVAFSASSPTPSIDWGDLSAARFSEPFFDQTVERWAGGNPPPHLIRTGIDALRSFENKPLLDPAMLIFHLSRCGSTLVSRLMSLMPQTLVIAEPGPINSLLMSCFAQSEDAAQIAILRWLVRALGPKRQEMQTHYVLKLSSWNVLRADLFRRAFPNAAIVWLQREPVEVMNSMLKSPTGWMRLRQFPMDAQLLFGIEATTLTDIGEELFCARALAAMLTAAQNVCNDATVLVNYRELPDAVWTRLAPLAGVTLDDESIAAMRDRARYHSKSIEPRLFVEDSVEKHDMPEVVQALAAHYIEPIYQDLERRRFDGVSHRTGMSGP